MFQLLRGLSALIHLSNGDIVAKLWSHHLPQKFFCTVEPCVQKKESRAVQGTVFQQKTTPISYWHHPALTKPLMTQVKIFILAQ